jgi:hypothetical protein
MQKITRMWGRRANSSTSCQGRYLAMAQRLCDSAMRHPTRKTRRYICKRGNAQAYVALRR